MSKLALIWPVRCQALLSMFVRDQEWEKRPRSTGKCYRILGKQCAGKALSGRWCNEHAYKEDIMHLGERRGYPACEVNPSLSILEGYSGWNAFAQVASRIRYAQLESKEKVIPFRKR